MRERRPNRRNRISKMISLPKRQRLTLLKKLLPWPKMQLLSRRKMQQIGKRLPRQPNLRLLRKWPRLKPLSRHKKQPSKKSNKKTRKSMMKL